MALWMYIEEWTKLAPRGADYWTYTVTSASEGIELPTELQTPIINLYDQHRAGAEKHGYKVKRTYDDYGKVITAVRESLDEASVSGVINKAIRQNPAISGFRSQDVAVLSQKETLRLHREAVLGVGDHAPLGDRNVG